VDLESLEFGKQFSRVMEDNNNNTTIRRDAHLETQKLAIELDEPTKT